MTLKVAISGPLALSPDGNMIACGNPVAKHHGLREPPASEYIVVWEIDKSPPQIKWNVDPQWGCAPNSGDRPEVLDLAFSPDGTLLA